MKVLLYVPSPGLLFSQSRNMLSVSAIKRPISFPYHPPPPHPHPHPPISFRMPLARNLSLLTGYIITR